MGRCRVVNGMVKSCVVGEDRRSLHRHLDRDCSLAGPFDHQKNPALSLSCDGRKLPHRNMESCKIVSTS